MFKRIIFLLLIIFAFNGCTRDDICPEGTATTPKLVIVFNNVLNPQNRKKVEDLIVETDYENSVIVLSRTATDTIAIPLSTTLDTTKYRFIRITGTEETEVRNIDYVTFIYSRKELYVNRACGFKMEFDNLEAQLQNEGSENWILNISTNDQTVKDENKAQLTFFH